MPTKDAISYKARKEAFVSNLSGSSITEINLVTLVAPAAILLWTALQRKQSLFTPYNSASFLADFLLNVCAILFAITIYSSAPGVLDIFLVTPAILFLLPLQNAKPTPNESSKKPKGHKSSSSQSEVMSSSSRLVVRPFLTHYRGAMLIITTLAILAVDFPMFPRRYAKVETWGTSLMDLGVGSFVFSAGVVSARSVIKAQDLSSNVLQMPLSSRLVKASRHSLPLLALGLIRLYSVKGLDYAEHVTEYGVHWNFFFTLGFLPPFVELADSIIRSGFKSYDFLAVTIAVMYEIVLNNTSLLSYILISPRGPDLLSKNREGVFSFIGYLSIFLAGRGTGTKVVSLSDQTLKAGSVNDFTKTNKERINVLKSLAVQASIYIVLYVLATQYYALNLVVSRRLANLPYVVWVVAFNNAQILLFGVVESLGPQFTYRREDENLRNNASSKIMQVFNQNGLVIFLVANLLTGLVNLTVNTLDMSNLGALCILTIYAGAVTLLALGLDHFGVKIKL